MATMITDLTDDDITTTGRVVEGSPRMSADADTSDEADTSDSADTTDTSDTSDASDDADVDGTDAGDSDTADA